MAKVAGDKGSAVRSNVEHIEPATEMDKADTAQQPSELIAKPQPQETKIIEPEKLDSLQFDFDLAEVVIDINDIDVIMQFPDGGTVVLVGMALEIASGNVGNMQFADGQLSPHQLMAESQNMFEAQDKVVANMTTINPQKGTGKGPVDFFDSMEEGGLLEEVEDVVGADVSPTPQTEQPKPEEKKHDFEDEQQEIEEAVRIPEFEAIDFESLSAVVNGIDEPGASFGEVVLPKINVRMLGFDSGETRDTGDGVTEFRGSLGVAQAANSQLFSVQERRDSIAGNEGDNVIYADDPDFAPSGKYVRKLEISADFDRSDVSTKSLLIQGLPNGYSILDAEKVDGGYKLELDGSNIANISLSYTLPSDGDTADANGFFSQFYLNFHYELINTANGTEGVASNYLLFGVRDVKSESDATFTNDQDEKVYVLWSRPPGTEVDASEGDDTIYAGAGFDSIDGGEGNDTLSYRYSHDAVDVNLDQGTGKGGYAEGDVIANVENLEGSSGDDRLTGNSEDNRIAGLAGADQIDGLGGVDTADYSESDAAVTVNLADGTASGGHAEGDRLSNIENLVGSKYDDQLTGNASDNVIEGGQGDDRIAGLQGADTIEGGAGIDTVDYSAATGAVNVSLQTGEGSGDHAQGDVISNVENIVGSDHADQLTGDGKSNRIEGGRGNDTIKGLEGGDIIDGGSGVDTVDYSDSNFSVLVDLENGQTSSGHAHHDQLRNIENITGSNFADHLVGDAGANTLRGLGGADILIGGAGADIIDGGQGFDRADYTASDAAININLATNHVSGGHAEDDTLRQVEDITGSAHNDVLIGNAYSNRLDGGDGDDLLIGLHGADHLIGGAGRDHVDYSASDAGVEVDLHHGYGNGGHASLDELEGIEDVTGSSYGDVLTGTGAANRLVGRDGNDVLEGRAGADELIGGSGDDMASYEHSTEAVTINLNTGAIGGGDAEGDVFSSIESLQGSANNDSLTGDAGANRLIGLDGNDYLVGLAGGDQLFGGAGSDRIDYSASNAAVNVNLQANLVSGGHASGDTIKEIEEVIGTRYNDVLTGTEGINYIDGRVGNDVITGGAGADTMIGGTGVDTIIYSSSDGGVNIDISEDTASGAHAEGDVISGFENVYGSNYADTIIGNDSANSLIGHSGDDILSGGAGNDYISGGDGSDQIDGGTGDDTVSAGNGNDKITGGDGHDRLYGHNGNDEIDGGSGHDTISGGGDHDRITGGDGYDRLYGDSGNDQIDGGSGNDTISGGAGNDRLTGGDGHDRINGDSGNDYFVGGIGSDTMDGGSGWDTVDYSASNSNVHVNLHGNVFRGGHAHGDRLSNMEHVIGSEYNDYIFGSASNNLIKTLGGNDYIHGYAGADAIYGGEGIDTVDYYHSNGGVHINLATNSGNHYHARGDKLYDVENVNGSNHADTLVGDEEANILQGRNGHDRIYAGGGNDTIRGGNHNDTIYGQAGDDTIYGEGHNDTIRGDAGNDTIHGGNNNDTLSGGSGNDKIYGGNHDDSISGGTGADYLDGGSGNDWLMYNDSSAGVNVNLITGIATGGVAEGDRVYNFEYILGSRYNDSFYGRSVNERFQDFGGADHYDGGGGSGDWVDYARSNAGVQVNLTTGVGTGGYAQGDSYVNIEGVGGSNHSDNITGSAAANSLHGHGGHDTITGAAGNDQLYGGAGNDRLIGGSGADIIHGQDHYDTLIGDAGNDKLYGGNHNDTLLGGDGNDMLYGGNHHDTLRGGDGNDILYGESHNDTLVGGNGADALYGGDGNDTLIGGTGADYMDGGSNWDRVDYQDSARAVTVNLTSGTGQGGDAHGDRYRYIENITGSDHDDTLIGHASTNAIIGGNGDDTISGMGGADYLYGGVGIDTVSYDGSSAAVNVNLDTNTVSSGHAAGDRISGFENIIGSSFADNLVGSAVDNIINSNGGKDVIRALEGDDTIIVDSGALFSAQTSIDGGDGHDSVVVAEDITALVESNLGNILDNVEELDFTALGVTAVLDFDASEIQDITDDDNELTVNINTGDTVTIDADTSEYSVAVSGNATSYTIYDQDEANPAASIEAILHVVAA